MSNRRADQSDMEHRSVRQTYKYRLKPTPEQARTLDVVLWRCRTLYNVALAERQTAWERGHVAVSYYQQKAELPELKRACPEFADVHAHVLQDVILWLDRVFQAFFRRVKAGESPGYPRFQGRGRYNSLTYPEYGNGVVLDGGLLRLSKIGHLRVTVHRLLEGTPKTVTILREADGWYACFSCADVPIQSLPRTGQETGIDLGLESFVTLADGGQIANPRIFHVAEMALTRAQRRVSRRMQGSHRRRKAVTLLAKAHLRVRRARADFHHKTALALVQTNDTIYHEALQTANMVKNHHLAKSIADAGWSAFLAILSCKAAYAGKTVVAVPPAFTSQACSGCAVLVQKALSVRWHSCPECGTNLHREHNAARNILWIGSNGRTRGVGQAPQALTWPSGASVA